MNGSIASEDQGSVQASGNLGTLLKGNVGGYATKRFDGAGQNVRMKQRGSDHGGSNENNLLLGRNAISSPKQVCQAAPK
jgi:hypothetical protein